MLSSTELAYTCISALARRRLGEEDEAANGDGLQVDGLLQLLGKLSEHPVQTETAALVDIGMEPHDLTGQSIACSITVCVVVTFSASPGRSGFRAVASHTHRLGATERIALTTWRKA